VLKKGLHGAAGDLAEGVGLGPRHPVSGSGVPRPYRVSYERAGDVAAESKQSRVSESRQLWWRASVAGSSGPRNPRSGLGGLRELARACRVAGEAVLSRRAVATRQLRRVS